MNYFTLSIRILIVGALQLCAVIGYSASTDSLENILKNPSGKSIYELNQVRLRLAQEYMQVNRYAESLKLLTEALKVCEEKLNNPSHYADVLGRTADLYNYMQNSELSSQFYRKSLKILFILSEKENYGTLITTLNNAGLVHVQNNFPDSAVIFYNKAIGLAKKYNHEQGLSLSLGNLGYHYEMEGDYDKALSYYFQSYSVAEKSGNIKGIAFNLNNIGFVYTAVGKYDEAEKHFHEAFSMAKSEGMKDLMRDSYEGLTALFTEMNDLEKALEYQKKLNLIFDSLYHSETSKQIAEMNAKYETEKRKKELLKKQAEADQKDAEAKQNATERNFLMGGFIIVVVLAFYIFRGYRRKKKDNLLISQQKEEVEKQKHIIEEKNKDISDSISYAQRIQQSFLASKEEFDKAFNEYFILYKPKDVVSGDCYWIANVSTTPKDGEQRRISVVSAIDCTGHGVPGALMSIVAMTLLNQSMKNPNINSASDALNYLNRELPKNIKSKEGDKVRDGMDMSMCVFFHDKLEMHFAAANNPAYLIRQGELTILKPDKQAITSADDMEKPDFNLQTISLQKDDCIYLFTDGFADQFGGEKGKKFTYKRLQESLLSIYHLPMNDQKNKLEKTFSDWKGINEQIDDVLLIGIKI